MSKPAPEPSAQEIQRKLSVHSVAKPRKIPALAQTHVSGTESDSDSALSPDLLSTQSLSSSGVLLGGSSSQPPLSSIAERRSGSGEESDEDDEDDEEGWKGGEKHGKTRVSADESVIKAGYLWKKGERRKTWKKRWFVLRPAHLAYYKTSAEYKLLHLLDLSDIHSCTPVALKKHTNTFGLVSAVRTFYLQAVSAEEVQQWVQAIQEARESLMATSTQNSYATAPIPIPGTQGSSHPPPVTPSPPSHVSQNITSSDSEDASPSAVRTYSSSSQTRPVIASSPSRPQGLPKDVTKIVLSGYLMKCGSKRHNWRKRWFVLNGEKLVYSGSHMDTKPHRQFSFSEILDALEFDIKANRHGVSAPPTATSSIPSSSPEVSSSGHGPHTFKIVTTKRTLLLCAPSEEEEIKWLSAIRALIARRTGAGVVPGESSSNASRAMSGSIDAGQGSGGGVGSAGSGGLRNKVRKLSVSGTSTAVPIPEGSLER
ncbi:hypothetical protein SERLA73DRAFT_181393 [Serpula lacrymans var. lacrymans S7.3]|uniref:PH domain-containing protein n=2 Tax=Serpula lacrymans var. lacrymans TaxID=341189 RepID=F8PXZ8_SERL3|nr:uncharacterized protein SERLADRAFT_467514 [Serpula lacrymans var. lacrymans S7.9]EGN98761.1 hypothetical protein SERLA73DRAFT_181393 [Serpula lacrymans var. lacrymans S7.3]EGO24356.1 hypothetical protein SERLADRAFT_467514 [Serpula lacrymans var. lacrymans S7.9]